MSELGISSDISIDEIENVIRAIFQLSGKRIEDGSCIASYVNSQNNTRFYIDKKFNSFMDNNPNAIYLLLDTGFTTSDSREPIFVCLKNRGGGCYSGHFTETAKSLAKEMKSKDHKNRSSIDANYSKFMRKYSDKKGSREIKAMPEDISSLFLQVSNGKTDSSTAFYNPFASLNPADFPQNEIEVVEVVEVPDDMAQPEGDYGFSEEEEDITIGILLDKLEKMDAYIHELQGIVDELSKKNALSEERIKELEIKKKEIERDFVAVRTFMAEEQSSLQHRIDETKKGHNLLQGHGQILVLGACGIGDDVMKAIARDHYGFEKKDFLFETDYNHSVSVAGRVNKGGRFKIVILGAMPHSVKGKKGETSFLETLRNDSNVEMLVDARSKSRELKVTKESFREALMKVITYLERQE